MTSALLDPNPGFANDDKYYYIFIKTKGTSPRLPKHPGKQLKDQPPQQIVRHCGSCIIAPITSGSCSKPPFYRGTTRYRKWDQRATPPLLCHRVDESLLTYTAASPPRTHCVPPMGLHNHKVQSKRVLLITRTRLSNFHIAAFRDL
ncbi:hypothetical protein AVEN_119753-1 [Araneus ventricosus]|uniref:Uncharacterized protein n=1 Tax=Araneus ventricosus TaxID=182803 RepID=A0A4Y2FCW3_ARAVE|nr:hypothetical protein AVEN_119753-1 [Araneus ventricosus]